MEKNNIQTAEDYELLYDLHTHTTYSHGKGSIEDNVREAFNQGLEFVAILGSWAGTFVLRDQSQ